MKLVYCNIEMETAVVVSRICAIMFFVIISGALDRLALILLIHRAHSCITTMLFLEKFNSNRIKYKCILNADSSMYSCYLINHRVILRYSSWQWVSSVKKILQNGPIFILGIPNDKILHHIQCLIINIIYKIHFM